MRDRQNSLCPIHIYIYMFVYMHTNYRTCEMDMMRVKKAYKKYIKSSTDETVLFTSLRIHTHKRLVYEALRY